MFRNISWKRFLKSVALVALALTFVFTDVSSALAARSGERTDSIKKATLENSIESEALIARRSGGRIGGGGFSRPSQSAPSRGGGSRGGGFGGGFGFPFLLPFFGFGGFGSIFTILIFFAVANFLVRSFQNAGFGGGGDGGVATTNPKVTVSKVQVGLLADAKELQKELNDLAQKSDTGTASGRAKVLQEGTLALLRHPEYWVYAKSESNVARLEEAEAEFNRLALSERSKYSEETLSNVESQFRRSESETTTAESPSEYIVVTILAGVQGKSELPDVKNADNLRQALRQLGSASSDTLLAVELIWTPQAEGDTLSNDDLLTAYADLQPL